MALPIRDSPLSRTRECEIQCTVLEIFHAQHLGSPKVLMIYLHRYYLGFPALQGFECI
jgi:hypothetical protein